MGDEYYRPIIDLKYDGSGGELCVAVERKINLGHTQASVRHQEALLAVGLAFYTELYAFYIRQLLEEDIDLLSRNRIRELAEKYGLTAAQMQQRVDVIRSLSPAPGSVLSQPEETVYLLPDVLLEKRVVVDVVDGLNEDIGFFVGEVKHLCKVF